MIIRRAPVKICGARCRSRVGRCRNRVPPGWKRCKFHGGASTGPKTAEGMALSLAARDEGHDRWFERMRALKAAGLIEKFPCGRKPGVRWITPRMRARALGLPANIPAAALPRILAADIATPEGRVILDANKTAAASALDELEALLT